MMIDKNNVYVEILGNISIVNGVVHMDFYTQDIPRPEKNDPQLVFSHRTSMPLRGFVSSAQTLDDFIKQLSDKGILKRDGKQTGAQKKAASSNSSARKSP